MVATGMDLWRRGMATGIAGAQTGLRLVELMLASQQVIASRLLTIAAAVRDPLNGDYAELGRMLPEKVNAFGKAGEAAAAELQALHADALASWQHVAGLAWGARMPTEGDLDAFYKRSIGMTERVLGAGGKALLPVHRAATGNASRLRRTRRR